MVNRLSDVVNAEARQVPGFNALHFVDLEKLGVHASPLAVLDDFRVQDAPFSAHPHVGFAAATYVFEDSIGAVRSRTSTGVDVEVGAGGIVWTQAGSGVIHEEVPAVRGQELHGLQLFVNLSNEHKLSPPRVFWLDGGDVPKWHGPAGDQVRVVVGSFEGVDSPLVPDEPFTFLDVQLRREVSFAPRADDNAVVYGLAGEVVVTTDGESATVRGGQAVAVAVNRTELKLESAGPAHVLVLGGPRIDEPVIVEGPFIVNDRLQLEAALARYRSGAMGSLSPRDGA